MSGEVNLETLLNKKITKFPIRCNLLLGIRDIMTINACFTWKKDLINYDNSKDNIKLYLTDDVANLVISAGLTNWVIRKTI